MNPSYVGDLALRVIYAPFKNSTEERTLILHKEKDEFPIHASSLHYRAWHNMELYGISIGLITMPIEEERSNTILDFIVNNLDPINTLDICTHIILKSDFFFPINDSKRIKQEIEAYRLSPKLRSEVYTRFRIVKQHS